jgi:hypothetical protein
MSEPWTDDDRFFLVEQMRRKQREFHSRVSAVSKASLLRECKALEQRVDNMLANRKGPQPRRDLFGEEIR